jgi:LCP family protein required for cell wall assembly
MARSDKGYRRFRSRGGGGDETGGLDALREMTAREAGSASAPPPPAREDRPLGGTTRERDRERKRALARHDRRWWSLRGLGPGGWIGRIAVFTLLAFAVWAAAGFLALRSAVGDANAGVTPSAKAALDPLPGGMLGTPTNILVLGVDTRRGQTRSRADTIMIMRTDPDSGRLKYLSIPRDFRVELPGQGAQKINAAFYFGGQAGAIKAVKRLTGIPIHHVIVIKFSGLAEMVDALGGVTVNNPTAVVDCYYEAGQTVNFPKGPVTLDGETALQFARVRKCDDDLRRAVRQQLVVSALKDRVLAPTSLWKAPWQGADVVRALQTDIGTIDMMKLGWLQARLTQEPSDRIILTGEPLMIDGQSFIVGTDPDRNEREIAAFMSSS